jgi:hypothetical protein
MPNSATIFHAKVARATTGTDPERVYGTDWNDDHVLTGLDQVDNTSDATKNAATATLTNKSIDGTQNTLTNIPPDAFAPIIEQHITDAGPVDIGNDTAIVRVDQDTGAPITLTLPAAADKTCPVLISDWKGDAGTNNITINASGTDTFPGGLTTWTIAGDGGSVFFRPIADVGYAL